MRILLLLVCIAVLASGCAAHPELPPPGFDQTLPAVAAQFQTIRHCEPGNPSANSRAATDDSGAPVDWRFFRSAERLTIDNLSAQTGEDWQRDGTALFMRKLFHIEHKAIEYRNDDLSLLEISPQWQNKALLIDPDELAQLGAAKAYWADSIPIYLYHGDIDGETLLVEWRADLAIPVRIQRKAGACEEITRLQQATALDASPWPIPAIDDYLVIDYSDIGDMERDPFINQVYSQLPGGDVHHH